jgi:HEPN domain
MSALDDARIHLGKAREFLEAAELTRDMDLHNAAASNAVTSGINSKDAICLTLTGRTGKTDNHSQVVAELKATGPDGRRLAPTLDRLLRLKPKAQYQSESVSARTSARAIEWATRLLEAAGAAVR